MQGKITLVTPPDVYENSNPGLLFIDISDSDQTLVSQWLSKSSIEHDVNFYLYNGEDEVPWFFWALGSCQYKYIDLDCVNDITKYLMAYVLSKSNVFYKTNNESLAKTYSYINNNRITSIEDFLERSLGEQIN